MTVAMTGGCACGEIRYECSDAPIVQLICHCRDCQRASGAASAPIMFVPADRFSFLKAQPSHYEITGGSGRQIRRCFCGKCGSPVTAHWPENTLVQLIQVSSLDDPSVFRPTMELWLSRGHAWHSLNSDTEKFDGPPSGVKAAIEAYFAGRAASAQHR